VLENVRLAVQAVKLGAGRILRKPTNEPALIETARRALRGAGTPNPTKRTR